MPYDEEQDPGMMPTGQMQKRGPLNAYGSAALRGMAGGMHGKKRIPYGNMGAGIGDAIGSMMKMHQNRQMDPGAVDAGSIPGAPQNPQAGLYDGVMGYGQGAQPAAPPPIMPKPAFSDGSEQDDDAGMMPMAHGGIVYKPTKILAGESGPEAIVPLNNNPQNKVSTSILRQRR